MIHELGKFVTAGRNLDGDMTLTFCVNDIEPAVIDQLKDTELVIDIKKYSSKRSLNANAYFWVLCDQIAKKLGSDKDTIYLLQLSKYGVFVDIQIVREAVDSLKEKFRYVEEFDDGYATETITARCYFGSSQYSKKEMYDLIQGTKADAIDLGITTWSEEEINRVIDNWKGIS